MQFYSAGKDTIQLEKFLRIIDDILRKDFRLTKIKCNFKNNFLKIWIVIAFIILKKNKIIFF